ncbi:SMC-Scp complex subunit ScpB [Entomobacter blattae]|uniref:Segregation and condensation protein B n=1 Tax=Entomobacter blattae TaxID=2762277 RepID=A0A7H1NUB2_9PROT|nr:SMC-Scp complex subunit ScpB [Entomobacter blattae]QNT79372.1 Segregation and condensation protein B [Entomobacter blattae]
MEDNRQDSIFSVPLPDDALALQGIRVMEAALFSASEPMTKAALLAVFERHGLLPAEGGDPMSYVEQLLEVLKQKYREGGITLVPVGKGWQFRTAPDLASYLTKVVEKPRRLTKPALETLAIIAYHQPCTRADIEAIRGVSLNTQIMDLLLELSLIVSKGRKEVPGRPVLWGTTEIFLQHFGLTSLQDLPKREELLVDQPGDEHPLESHENENNENEDHENENHEKG